MQEFCSQNQVPISKCGICQSRQNLNMRPKCYVSSANSGAVSTMAVQAHIGVSVSIAMYACEDALSRRRLVLFFPLSTLLLCGKPSFLHFSLQPSSVNRVSSVNGRFHYISIY